MHFYKTLKTYRKISEYIFRKFNLYQTTGVNNKLIHNGHNYLALLFDTRHFCNLCSRSHHILLVTVLSTISKISFASNASNQKVFCVKIMVRAANDFDINKIFPNGVIEIAIKIIPTSFNHV